MIILNNIDYGKKITDEYRKQTLEYGRKTFNLKDDIVYQISMMSYDKYNDKIATMYDNTDVYSYSEIEDEKRAELEYELELSNRAIEYLQLLLSIIIDHIKENCIDDEFDVNLTRKEKNIKYILEILEILDKENQDDKN